MKRFRFLLVLPLLFSLLAYTDQTLPAARQALSLWWENVVPVLLPFMVGCGLLSAVMPRPRGARALVPAFLAGAICGYPMGGKLLGDLVRAGAISPRGAQKAALVFNLPSPVFLLSIIACGLFQSKAFFLPLAVACYAPPLACLPFLRLKTLPCPTAVPPAPRLSAVITDAVTDGVSGVLRIGGCIVTATVLTALLSASGLFSLSGLAGVSPALAEMLTAGMLEMTAGCFTAAVTALSLRMRLCVCAFFVSFGGLSVFLQTACFLPFPNPIRYLAGKLLLGLSSAALMYFLFPLFALPEPVLPALSQGAVYLSRAAATGALLLSALVSLLTVALFSLLGKRPRTI